MKAIRMQSGGGGYQKSTVGRILNTLQVFTSGSKTVDQKTAKNIYMSRIPKSDERVFCNSCMLIAKFPQAPKSRRGCLSYPGT